MERMQFQSLGCLFAMFKGGLTCKNNILFYWLFLNLGLSTVRKNFSRFFVAVVSAEIEVKNRMCSLWWIMGAVIRDVTKGSVGVCTVCP